MLPEVCLGRHCCAPSTNPDNYRPLVGEALIDEIRMLARDELRLIRDLLARERTAQQE
jgi:hypothetical protein